jgi:hypothetical protein
LEIPAPATCSKTTSSVFSKPTRKIQTVSIAKNAARANYHPTPKESVAIERRIVMKQLTLTATAKAMIVGAFFMGATVVSAGAQETSCTNHTLKGDYAFTVSGQVFVPVKATDGTVTTVVIQRDGIAMTHFDGEGNLSQVDFVESFPLPNPPPPPPPTDPVTGFHTEETGTYTVFADCTGTFTIKTPPTSPIVVVKFALSNGGRSIHTIVTSLTLPGTAMPVPALIHSEGHRLGRIVEWWE